VGIVNPSATLRSGGTGVCVLWLTAAWAGAGDWPAFRGPDGSGVAHEIKAPLRWGPGINVLWNVPLPGPDNSSPIVSRGRVTSQRGVTSVFRPNPDRFELLATNDLGEPSHASPAISDGQIPFQPIATSAASWKVDRFADAATLTNPTPAMKKINTHSLPEITWTSPKGKFCGAGKEVSEALGREPGSSDLRKRHPFDVEIARIPPGKSAYPYHSHSAQWEFYHVIAGTGLARHEGGTTPIEPGDAFIFEPGQPHQLINNSDTDLVVYVVADNPIGESGHFPDSGKWLVRSPERCVLRSNPLDYYDGEE
jgi:uncharacterized cupin superfamily protein